jgi:putative transposase
MVQSELKLGKSVMDLGYASFVNKLIYKAKWQDKTVLLADKWFASSKTCNICGYVNRDLRLQDREWICPSCGTRLLRDQNAAINLKNLVGLGQPDFKPVEKLTAVNSAKQEAKML